MFLSVEPPPRQPAGLIRVPQRLPGPPEEVTLPRRAPVKVSALVLSVLSNLAQLGAARGVALAHDAHVVTEVATDLPAVDGLGHRREVWVREADASIFAPPHRPPELLGGLTPDFTRLELRHRRLSHGHRAREQVPAIRRPSDQGHRGPRPPPGDGDHHDLVLVVVVVVGRSFRVGLLPTLLRCWVRWFWTTIDVDEDAPLEVEVDRALDVPVRRLQNAPRRGPVALRDHGEEGLHRDRELDRPVSQSNLSYAK